MSEQNNTTDCYLKSNHAITKKENSRYSIRNQNVLCSTIKTLNSNTNISKNR